MPNQKQRREREKQKQLNPEKFKVLLDKENSSRERNKKLYEEKQKDIKDKREKDLVLKKTEEEEKKKNQERIKNENLIANWEKTKIKNNVKFHINDETSLILTLFQGVSDVTLEMLSLLLLIFSQQAYISCSVKTNVLDNYKDDNKYTVMFQGKSMEMTPQTFKGKVVYGKKIENSVDFSDIYSPHLILPGIIMKKLIEKEIVIPVLYC